MAVSEVNYFSVWSAYSSVAIHVTHVVIRYNVLVYTRCVWLKHFWIQKLGFLSKLSNISTIVHSCIHVEESDIMKFIT